jgi:hypothetical protein
MVGATFGSGSSSVAVLQEKKPKEITMLKRSNFFIF